MARKVDPSGRRQTVFRADERLLTAFQTKLKASGQDMSPVIEGWIRQCVEGALEVTPFGKPPVLAQEGHEPPEKITREQSLRSATELTPGQKLLGVESFDSGSRDPVSAERLRHLLLEFKAEILAELAVGRGAKPPRPRKAQRKKAS